MAPKDGPELIEMMQLGLELECSSGIRYARGNAPEAHDLVGWDGRRQPVELGKMEILRPGQDGAILAYGHMVQTALEAAEMLEKKGVSIEVVNGRFAKPLDEEGILALADRHDKIVTLEDHTIAGGFGSAVLEMISQHGPVRAQFQLMGVPDRWLQHASRKQILEEIGLDALSVAGRFPSSQTVPVR